MSNIISTPATTLPNLEDRVDALIAKREKWEAGEYLSSTTVLYNVLSDCLEIKYFLEAGGIAARTAFEKILERDQIKFRADTPLTKSIVRVVFGDCKRRADIYSSTLQSAYSRDISPGQFPQWVKSEGGVEQASELKSLTRKAPLSQEKLIKVAEAVVPTMQVLASIPTIDELQPASNSYYTLSVALLRRAGDGSTDVIFGTNKKTVISAVLATMGKKIASQKAETEIVESSQAERDKQRQKLTQALAAIKAGGSGENKPHASNI